MINTKSITLCLLVTVTVLMTSCKTKIDPVETRIKKVWTASTVKENAVEVFKLGAATNSKPGYASYKLDLSVAPTATIKEVDGGTYTGKYSISGGNTLVITGLTPEPTGTGGSLEYSISSLSDDGSTLTLTANKAYPKTGGTTNIYSLVASK